MSVRLIQDSERGKLQAIGRLAYANPFLGERIELERRVLGETFTPIFPVWHARADLEDDNPNILGIAERTFELADRMLRRLDAGARMTAEDRRLYQDTCLYALYYRCQQQFLEMILRPQGQDGQRRAPFYSEFRKELERLLGRPEVQLPQGQTPEHLFACFFQVRRAFHYIFRSIGGVSMPAARLRSHVWQSIFTYDERRYQRRLYDRMGEITTLITGPSGAGKDLVARAIGLSRYIPFDPKTLSFRESYEESFYALNLPALSPTLIESELFGHRRGAFTGAVSDRKGWLEVCPPLGTVFLDEIGEVEESIQIKLLRVLETRKFQRLGTTDALTFRGKVVAATNRDLARELCDGRFRKDLYYRLCADIIEAPSLRERIADSPDELTTLIEILAERLVGEEDAASLAGEARNWIEENLGRDYAWPGNVRELSQCVSNLRIRRDYRPVATLKEPLDREQRLGEDFLAGRLNAEEMLRTYCTLVYRRTGSYLAAGERLGLDRRTVKTRVDPNLLEKLRD